MKTLLLAACLLLAFPGHAGDPAVENWTLAFEAANDAYEAGQHQDALDQYEALLEEVSHFSSEYNAGNAAYKLSKLGVARLHYERANASLAMLGWRPTWRCSNPKSWTALPTCPTWG